MSSERLSDTEWRPKATVGPVPRQTESYTLSPLSLPKPPPYTRDPKVRALGDSLFQAAKHDAEAGMPDPWARLYEFRNHPYYSGFQKIKRAWPGFGIGLVAFGIYVGLEKLGIIPQPNHEHH